MTPETDSPKASNGVAADREPSPPSVDYRYSLANERTFLAWTRTALALIAAGVAALHLLADSRIGSVAGISLVAAGMTVTAAGYRRWLRNSKAIAEGSPLDSSRIPVILAAAILTIGILLLVERLIQFSAGA